MAGFGRHFDGIAARVGGPVGEQDDRRGRPILLVDEQAERELERVAGGRRSYGLLGVDDFEDALAIFGRALDRVGFGGERHDTDAHGRRQLVDQRPGGPVGGASAAWG